MKFLYIFLTIIFFSILNLFAEETRQVDKHEHGVGELNIAIDSNIMNFEFMLPGADIVGFEYKAQSEEDVALVNNALAKFEDFNNIFIIPKDGLCQLSSSEVTINQQGQHNEFQVEYSFECKDTKIINKIIFPYFSTFENSGELEIQFISELGSSSFRVQRNRPFINTKGKI